MVASYSRRKASSKRDQLPASFPKVYAVAVGRDGPRIYRTLQEFEANVKGFPGGSGKAFGCPKKAQDWLNQLKRGRTTKEGRPHPSPPYSYADATASGFSHEMDKSVSAPGPASAMPGPLVDDRSPSPASFQIDLSKSPYNLSAYNHLYPRMDVVPLGAATEDYNVPEPVHSKPALPQRPVKDQPNALAEYTPASVKHESKDSSETGPVLASPIIEDPVAHFSEKLSMEQREILRVVHQGESIFFTGAAGTGKSVTLRALIEMTRHNHSERKSSLAITASTGIAALNVGGETLHAFAGVGLAKKSVKHLVWMVLDNEKVLERWKALETLIIDEISMIDGVFFDKLEEIARSVRGNNLPFGGVQLVICGDFFQLPPVPDQYLGAPVPACFAFEARSWRHCIKLQMRLTQVFRQKDLAFIKILNQMRVGQVNSDSIEQIRHLSRDVESNGIEPVQIYPLTKQVQSANVLRLDALPGKVFSNEAIDRGRWMDWEKDGDTRAHQERIANLLDRYSIAPRSIMLKEGAQVMLTRNLVQGRLVNGSLGRVVGFTTAQDAKKHGVKGALEILKKDLEKQLEEQVETNSERASLNEQLRRLQKLPSEIRAADLSWPVVEFTNTDRVLFEPLPFDTEDAFGHLEATRVQVPLILAWAITVHKSQGQTIERLKIDFKGTFEHGQAYVAMSRAVGLDTLQVLNFEPTLVRAHPHVLQWYDSVIWGDELDSEEAVKAYFAQC